MHPESYCTQLVILRREYCVPGFALARRDDGAGCEARQLHRLEHGGGVHAHRDFLVPAGARADVEVHAPVDR